TSNHSSANCRTARVRGVRAPEAGFQHVLGAGVAGRGSPRPSGRRGEGAPPDWGPELRDKPTTPRRSARPRQRRSFDRHAAFDPPIVLITRVEPDRCLLRRDGSRSSLLPQEMPARDIGMLSWVVRARTGTGLGGVGDMRAGGRLYWVT